MNDTYEKMREHLRFSIAHGGFEPTGICGGCSCLVCSFIRGYIRDKDGYKPSRGRCPSCEFETNAMCSDKFHEGKPKGAVAP